MEGISCSWIKKFIVKMAIFPKLGKWVNKFSTKSPIWLFCRNSRTNFKIYMETKNPNDQKQSWKRTKLEGSHLWISKLNITTQKSKLCSSVIRMGIKDQWDRITLMSNWFLTKVSRQFSWGRNSFLNSKISTFKWMNLDPHLTQY